MILARAIACIGMALGATPALAQALPSDIGEWAPLQSLPFRPVHSVLLPTGKVMMYSTLGNGPLLWEPADGSLVPTVAFDHNPFCNGHAHTADGNVFFAGGQVGDLNNVGVPSAEYYDPVAGTFTPVAEMNAGRWYPSLVALGNGDIVVMSGNINVGVRNLIPEVWQAGSQTWRDLSGASLSLPLFPAAFLAPNGSVFVATARSRYLDTAGAGQWTTVADRLDSGRDDHGSACILDGGRVLYTGGGDAPLASGELIDLAAPDPQWSYITDMPQPRRQHNTTLLPDGRVLVTGGSSSAGFNVEDGAKPAIAWDPDTDSWETWAVETEYRGYHSESLLLPDGRIVSIGGDGHPSMQVFSPPYLFNGPRPSITLAPPSVEYGDTFFVETPDSASVSAAGGLVTWLRPGSVTHTKNMSQRINKLAFSESAGGLEIVAPADANTSPPGDYMLFLVNSSGVPSVAAWIRLAPEAPVLGLLESWQFDSDGDSRSGNNNATLLNGAAIVADAERGPVLSCDGVDDLAQVSNTVTPAFSWAGWVRTAQPSSGGIAGFEGDGLISALVAGPGNDFILSVLNDTLAFYSGDTGQTVYGTTPLTDDAWHHVAVTADGSAVNLYVDGVLDGSGGGIAAHLNASPDVQFCGNPANGTYFNGLVDALEQYDRALTASDITQLAAGIGTIPLAVDEIVSPPVVLAQNVQYAAVATGGANLQYRWDFGDGTPETQPDSSPTVSHAYGQPGIYFLTLTVTSATGESVVENFWQAVHKPHTLGRPTSSMSIVYEQRSGSDRVWNVNPDNDTVSVFDVLTLAKLAEITVGDDPRSLTLAGAGHVWVANKSSATISIIDTSTLKVTETVPLPYESRPHGIVVDPAGAAVYVALESPGQLLKLNPADASVLGTADTGANVRHLSITADSAYILAPRYITPPLPGEETAAPVTGIGGQLLGGEVLVVDAASMVVASTAILQHSEADDTAGHHEGDVDGHSSARGIPNFLGAAAISPDGETAWIPSKQDNIKRGILRDGHHLTHDTTLRAVSSRLDLSNGPAGATEDHASRVDHDNSAVPSAAAYGFFGNYVFVALEGSRAIRVIDAYGFKEVASFNVGRAPQGVVVSPDGLTLYTHNFMDRSISVHDVSNIVEQNDSEAVPVTTFSAVDSEALAANVLLGKQHFYDADDARLSLESYISCAGCHNDGAHDGRTWDFTGFGEGLRNTVDLRGRANHGPLHWTGNFDEVQDFENQLRALAQGLGLLSEAQFNLEGVADPLGTPKAGLSADLDALASYVLTLKQTPPSPLKNSDNSVTALAEQGRALFEAEGCGSCHSGHRYTDSAPGLLHAMPTIKASSGQRSGQPLTGLDTPSLKGLWTSAPYLHDGSAPDLASAVSAHEIRAFTATEFLQFEAFLNQLDDFATNIRIEAEDMSGSGFRNETVTRASNGQVINLKGASTNATVTASFGGDSGTYDILVGYHDENDGIALLNARVAGVTVGSLSFNDSPGGAHADVANFLVWQVAESYQVNTGDTIALAATQGNWDNANIDYIEFVPIVVENLAPVVTTAPVTVAVAGQPYEYDVDASDANAGDVLAYSLDQAPGGMAIDAASGSITWTPDTSQQGNNAVTVRVTDNGIPSLATTQSFQVDVSVVNAAPVITSSPVLSGQVGAQYSYDVDASDPDAGDVLAYTLDVAPAGMTIDTVSGLIGWTPVAGQEGGNAVTVRVTDSGSPAQADTQAFSVEVLSAGGNGPPQITSTPVTGATVDQAYGYDVEASDGNAGDTLTYSLDTAPPSMTIDSVSGVIDWLPVASDEGPHAVTVRVTDDGVPNLGDTQSFTVDVAPESTATLLRIEAEDMGDSGFRTESLSSASNGVVINLKGSATSGTATTTFGGTSGSYDIFVGYHDENDGDAQLGVALAGVTLDSWVLDNSPGGSHAAAQNFLLRQVATGYPVNAGDAVELSAVQGNWDNANLDYIEFVPTAGGN